VTHTYTPDFPLTDTVFIEVKGYFKAADRAKHLAVKEQHPDKKIYFLFANSKNKLNKNSNTTYGDWCRKHGFEFADIKDGIPATWLTKKGKHGNP
jgi:hypothetical protein